MTRGKAKVESRKSKVDTGGAGRRVVGLVALLLAPLAGGCIAGGSASLDVWAVGESDRVGAADAPRGESDVFSPARNQIELVAAANEVASFQLVLSGGGGSAALEFSSLAGRSGRAGGFAFSAFLAQPVTVSPAPAWAIRRYGAAVTITTDDVLIPLASPRLGGRVPLTAGRRSVVWIDCRIPGDTSADEYQGTIAIAQGSRRQSIGLVVRVMRFALPDERHLSILAGVDGPALVSAIAAGGRDGEAALSGSAGESARNTAFAAIRQALALLNEHRLNPYLKGVYPGMRFDGEGALQIDWTQYDDLVGPVLSASAASGVLRWWAIPCDRTRPPASTMGGIESPEYAAVLRQYVEACARHFEAKGWRGGATGGTGGAAGDSASSAPSTTQHAAGSVDLFVDMTEPIPEIPTLKDYANLARLSRICDMGDHSTAFIVNLFPSAMSAFGWPRQAYSDLREAADIWAPPAQFFDAARLSPLRQLGMHVWLTPDRPEFGGSVAAEASPTDVRAVAWHAYRQGAGVWLPQATGLNERAGRGVIAPEISRDWLVYPGSLAGMPGVLPSARLKHLLRGAQDFEYLWLLAQHGREATAGLIAQSLVKATGTQAYIDNYEDGATHTCVVDPDMWELPRRLAGEEIERALGGAVTQGAGAISERVNWGRFLNGTRQVIAWCEGARVTEMKHTDSPAYGLEVRIIVENQRTLPATGKLQFAALPDGWATETPVVSVGPLGDGERGRYRLTVQFSAWPATATGHVDLPVTLTCDGMTPVTISAVASFVRTARPVRPIEVDGRLDDWESTPGNVAGEFYSVGPAAQAGRAVQPRLRTADGALAYVARDTENLYVAIRCDGPSSAAANRGNNSVRYDGLMPVADELVEILIDPTNAATDNSAMYHLVFKAGGTLWAERGIGTPRPIGQRRPWGPDIRYATVADRGGWTTEVRIPLSSFEGDVRRNAVWGFDLTRFSTGRGQYGAWSGAARHVYNPRGMGNLWISD